MFAVVLDCALVSVFVGCAPQELPKTRAEQTGHTATSTNADVTAFLDGLLAHPGGQRLARHVIGQTVQGTPIVAVATGAQTAHRLERDPRRLRALVIANIHGGEVEGKEAVQVLLREIVAGEHQELLAAVDLTFLPVFNADGNDEIDVHNRVDQNGPERGVGRRHNSQDRDLNRDFVKLESPEVRCLIELMNRCDPHLFMDLHTTDGSHHGYHLTYCTSLAVNCDDQLASFMHDTFIPSVRKVMLEEHGLRIFDYGNFGRSGPSSGWQTFSADPRLAINYVGLRNRMSLLSEAYSHLDFAKRIEVTRAFVLSSLRELVRRGDAVQAVCAAADGRAARSPVRSGAQLAPPVDGELLVGGVERVPVPGVGERVVAKPEFTAVRAPIQVRFAASREVAMPEAGWLVVGQWPRVAQVLVAHGLAVQQLQAPAEVSGEQFLISDLSRQRAPFQGHRLVKLGGTLAPTEVAAPAGSLFVPAGHPLARLAAQLLEGSSDDGLATWGYFDTKLQRAADAGGGLGYPVLRLAQAPAADQLAPCVPERDFPRLVPYDLPLAVQTGVVGQLGIEVAVPGKRLPARGFEAEARYEGRTLRWRTTDGFLGEPAELTKWFEGIPPDAGGVVGVRMGSGVTHRELLDTVQTLKDAGASKVLLLR